MGKEKNGKMKEKGEIAFTHRTKQGIVGRDEKGNKRERRAL